MKRYSILLISVVLLGGCSSYPTTADRTVPMEKAKCTEPPPNYNDGVKQKLDAELKLTTIEVGKLQSEFSRNLSILSANTAEGNDLASILFYTCQISSSRGFSEDTTRSLMELAIKEWSKLRGGIRSTDELIAILSARAEGVVSKIRDSKREAIASKKKGLGYAKETDVGTYLDRVEQTFLRLHHQHVKALRAQQFAAAHEHVSQIHALLFQMHDRLFWGAHADPNVGYSIDECGFNRDAELYPGLDPDSELTGKRAMAVDWYEDRKPDPYRCRPDRNEMKKISDMVGDLPMK